MESPPRSTARLYHHAPATLSNLTDACVGMIRSISERYATGRLALRPSWTSTDGKQHVLGKEMAEFLYAIGFVWHGRGSDPEGYIYKTAAELQDECGLTLQAYRTLTNKIAASDMVEVKKIKRPDGAEVNAYLVPDEAKIALTRYILESLLDTTICGGPSDYSKRLRQKITAFLGEFFVRDSSRKGSERADTEVRAEEATLRGAVESTPPHKSTKDSSYTSYKKSYSVRDAQRSKKKKNLLIHQKIMNLIYSRLDGVLSRKEYGFNLGRMNTLLDTIYPDDTSLELATERVDSGREIPEEMREAVEAAVAYHDQHGELDVLKAWREHHTPEYARDHVPTPPDPLSPLARSRGLGAWRSPSGQQRPTQRPQDAPVMSRSEREAKRKRGYYWLFGEEDPAEKRTPEQRENRSSLELLIKRSLEEAKEAGS